MRERAIKPILLLMFASGFVACGGELGEGPSLENSDNALVASNGVYMNGVYMNGVYMNGVYMNGVYMNGVYMNGVTLQGSQLTGTLNGSQTSGVRLAGATMTDGSGMKIKIYSVAQDSDPDIWLYQLQGWNTSTNTWNNLCVDSTGTWQPAIAASGTWDSTGAHMASTAKFTFACRKIGAIAKCIDMKYKPWKSYNGVSLADYHQACTRMVRADYCGNGTAYTTNGTPIDVGDGLIIEQSKSDVNWSPDAEWDTNGAMCMTAIPRHYTIVPPCYQAKFNSFCGWHRTKVNNVVLVVPTPSLGTLLVNQQIYSP